jgi:hypothetical protein
MSVSTESLPVTATWPACDGLVRCMDCASQTNADKGGRMRSVCTAERDRPALVLDKWRRCQKYVARVKK